MDETTSSTPAETPEGVVTTDAAPPVRDLPPGTAANPEIETMLRLLDESSTHWRNEMLYLMSDEFPEGWGRIEPTVEEITWQPFPGSHSIGALLLHMGWVEIFWLHEVAAGRKFSEEKEQLLLAWPPEQDAVDAVQWPVPPAQPFSWYLDQLDAIRARTKELLQNASPDEIRTNEREGQRLSMRWLLGYCIMHDSYHGGQLVLLRLSQRAKKE